MLTELPTKIKPPDLVIPPRPQAMMVLMEEMPRAEPDLKRVTAAIQADPALAGAMLKVANSPAFGLARKATSITQAITFLGLRHIETIASGVALRQAMSGGSQAGLERFWDSAERVAVICGKLARKLRGIPADQAYTVGLFHDCGIPMLMSRYPNYRETLARANRGDGLAFDAVEEADIKTSHTTVGYFIARSWHLPEAICQSILWHHNRGAFSPEGPSGEVRSFIGLLQLGEHIQHLRMRSDEDVEWARFGDEIMAHFALTEEDYLNLVDEIQEELSEEAEAGE